MNPADLPIRQYTKDIVDALRNNDTIVVIGETGSGKTTQISQVSVHAYFQFGYLLRDAFITMLLSITWDAASC